AILSKALESDINELECFYQKVVKYQDEHQMHQWNQEDVLWETLSKNYQINDFVIGRINHKIVSACSIVDKDLLYWPEVKKGTTLFLHKLAIHPAYRKFNLGDQLLDYFKESGRLKRVKDVRLDVREYKHKLRIFYEKNGFKLFEIRNIFEEYQTALYYFPLENKKEE
ncbi:MAG: GNAT family N-acetyltransferase, partial [Erysipelotrichaceae bacterium]